MTLFNTCCETLHRSGGRMKVNERRTVVGEVDWPLCVPPTVERDRRAWPCGCRTGSARCRGWNSIRYGIQYTLCRTS